MANPLGALFEFLFKYRPAVFQQGDFAFGAPAPVALAAGRRRRDRRAGGAQLPARPRQEFASGTAGCSVAFGSLRSRVLLVCLMRPMLLLNAAVPQRNFVGVLIDDSRSMRIADRDGRQRADWIRDSVTDPESALLAALRARFQVKLFRFGATAERVDDHVVARGSMRTRRAWVTRSSPRDATWRWCRCRGSSS